MITDETNEKKNDNVKFKQKKKIDKFRNRDDDEKKR